METTIKTIMENEIIKVKSPYNGCFVSKARALKGSFSAGYWVFPASVKDHVLNAVRECYGVDGTKPYATCILIVTDYTERAITSGVELFGRPIAKAWGRDGGAKISDDVFFIAGKPTSGGSVKNWRTDVEHCDFEIHNFPVDALTRADVAKAIEEGWVNVKNGWITAAPVKPAPVEPTPTFPNGFQSWAETHHEVVECLLILWRKEDGVIADVMEASGSAALMQLGIDWTNEFEEKFKGRDWDGGYWNECVETFVHAKNYGHEYVDPEPKED